MDGTADADALSPPRAHGEPLCDGVIRRDADQFRVCEIPAHAPGGSGAHLWLEIERRGMNTEHAVRLLASAAGAAPRDVGYAGLKDRHARTRQWFSVPFAGDAQRLDVALEAAGLQVVARAFHARKLKRGALAGNHFRILVHAPAAERAVLEARAGRVRAAGVPNYFGPQRFGHGGGNLARARALFAGTEPVRERHRRGLYLSAARSALYNRVLAERVRAGTWNTLLPGEAVALAGSASFFVADRVDAALEQRLADHDVHPSGPLWGRGPSPARDAAAAAEAAALTHCADLRDGLAAAGLDHARRALRLVVPDLVLEPAVDGGWWIAFTLPPGAYATVVLAELFRVRDAAAERATG